MNAKPIDYKDDRIYLRVSKKEKKEIQAFMKANCVGFLDLIRLGIQEIGRASCRERV